MEAKRFLEDFRERPKFALPGIVNIREDKSDRVWAVRTLRTGSSVVKVLETFTFLVHGYCGKRRSSPCGAGEEADGVALLAVKAELVRRRHEPKAAVAQWLAKRSPGYHRHRRLGNFCGSGESSVRLRLHARGG